MSSTAPPSARSSSGNRSSRCMMSAVGPQATTLPSVQHHDVGGQPRDLDDRMADIDDRHPGLVAQPLDIGQDLGLARLVERSERLVHQDQPRAGEQRTADRHALLLAAGQQVRPAVEQVADAEQIDDRVFLGMALAARREPAAIGEVLPDASYAGTAAHPGTHSRSAACASARRCAWRYRPARGRRRRYGPWPA